MRLGELAMRGGGGMSDGDCGSVIHQDAERIGIEVNDEGVGAAARGGTERFIELDGEVGGRNCEIGESDE